MIRIYDSATYDANLTIDLPANGMLVIDCENEERPTLVKAAPLKVTSQAATAEEAAAFTLSGLLIEGSLEVSGKLNLTLTDCTLVPGLSLDEDGYPEHPDQASLVVSGTDVVDTSILIARSILGPLELPEQSARSCPSRTASWMRPWRRMRTSPPGRRLRPARTEQDPGPVTTLERVTVFGVVHVKELELASEVIFVHPVTADRRQEGCVRFSYIPRRLADAAPLPLPAGSGPGGAREKELDVTSLPPDEYDQHRDARAARSSPACATGSRPSDSLPRPAPRSSRPARRTARRWAPSACCSSRSAWPICGLPWTNTCASVSKPGSSL